MEERLPAGSPRFADCDRQRLKRNADRPRLDGYAEVVLECWRDLRGERQFWSNGMGGQLGPVPYTAIRTWCGDMDLDADEFRLVKDAIGVVDSEQGKQAQAESRLGGHGAVVERVKQEGKR